jgi:hypothetical protein
MTDRKNKTTAFLKRYCITIWLVIVSVAFLSVSTLAAYKYQQYAGTTVRNDVDGGIKFSSDVLEQENYSENKLYYSNYSNQPKYVYYKGGGTSSGLSVTFNVCNYPQSNPASYNRSNITYDVWAKFISKNGAKDSDIEGKCKLVNKETSEEIVLTAEDKAVFSGETLYMIYHNDSNYYTLTVDKAIVDKVEVVIEVRPVSDSLGATGNKMLSRRFVFSEYSDTETAWHGNFSETSDNTYWAYNYEISGTGSADVLLMWNTEKITLSKWAIDDLNAEEYTDDVPEKWKAVKFHAGEDGVTNYTVQFYRADGNVSNDKPESNWASAQELTTDEENQQ